MTALTDSLTHGPAARRSGRLFATLKAIVEIRRQRRQLRALDDAMLSDLGLSRGQALRESQRPVWDVPTDRGR